MKVQNPTKLDIFFKGGGIIKFPVQNLKQIDVEPIDEQGGDGSSSSIVNLLGIESPIGFIYVDDFADVVSDVEDDTLIISENIIHPISELDFDDIIWAKSSDTVNIEFVYDVSIIGKYSYNEDGVNETFVSNIYKDHYDFPVGNYKYNSLYGLGGDNEGSATYTKIKYGNQVFAIWGNDLQF